jgi:homoserine dehydrogenase
VFVELIGGADGSAKAAVEAALNAGKPVVTANKALIAEHGLELARLAEAKGVALTFEAAVMGGAPAVKLVRESLVGDEIASIAGILNGTCNYILSEMEASGRSFAEVLSEAQRLGYAEADPVMDVGGFDAAHKIAILAALAFGGAPNFAAAEIEGIEAIELLDITLAHELGYRIKLIASAVRQAGSGLSASGSGAAAVASVQVAPALVPLTHPLAQAGGALNALFIEGARTGRIFLQGAGAGAGPTASAVIADLIDIARGRLTPVWGAASGALSDAPSRPMSLHAGAYYLRLMVVDRPGVIAEITAVLRDHGVSLESMLQRGRSPGEAVPVVLVTHETGETAMRAALARLDALDAVMEPPTMIRIEPG